MSSDYFLIQIGYLSSENRRSCRRKPRVPEEESPGGVVFGEVIPVVSKSEAAEIRRKYEHPEWAKHIRKSTPKKKKKNNTRTQLKKEEEEEEEEKPRGSAAARFAALQAALQQ